MTCAWLRRSPFLQRWITSTPIPLKLRTLHNTFGTNHLKSLQGDVIVRGSDIPNYTINGILDEDLEKRIDLTPPTLSMPFWKKDRVRTRS